MIIRLVEFRGKGAAFAKKTLSIRRYGFVAFSMYNYQFLYFIPWVFITFLWQRFFGVLGGLSQFPIVFPNPSTRGNLDWYGALLVMGVAFLMFEAVLYLWERSDFAGGLEWCIGFLATPLSPVKKQDIRLDSGKRKWWQLLNAKGALYDAEWLNIVEESEIDHDKLTESRLARTLSIVGFFFFPMAIMALRVANKSFETEGVNAYNSHAEALAIIALIFTCIWIPLSFVLNLNMLGLTGLL
jgi:hypothetical protein